LRKIEPLQKKLLSKSFRSSASKRRLDETAIRQFLDGIPDGSDASGDEDDVDEEDDVDDSGQAGSLDEHMLLNLREAGVDRYSGHGGTYL
jgi:hypothetical protein